MPSTFSIELIVCTYNNAALLQRTLAAFYHLHIPSHIQWSVMVVNNNCTDNTAALVDTFINEGELPIRMITETKQGLTAARLCGVKNSEAGWIAFIDDDCLLSPEWIIEVERFCGTHPDCHLFGGTIKLLWEFEPPVYVHAFPFAYAAKNHGDSAKRVQTVAGAGMVVRREALENCGWIDEQLLADRTGKKLVSGGDMEIALRIGAYGEVWYNPACVLQHIIPKQRTTKNYLRRMLFGLGISRHHVSALQWKGSYLRWFVYTAIYSIGIFFLCVYNALRGKGREAGFGVVFCTYRGWCAGMWDMLRMGRQRRRKLLGGATRTRANWGRTVSNKQPTTLIPNS